MLIPRLLALAAVLLLAGCGTTTVVREEPARGDRSSASRPSSSTAAMGPSYRVRPGDTLYGIAFRNQMDWRELARWNGIAQPYTIVPDQMLVLSAPSRQAPPTRLAERPAGAPPPIPRGPAGSSPPAGALPAPATSARAVAVAPAAAPVAVAPAAPASSPPAAAPRPGSTIFRAGQWQSPTDGQVVSRFADGDKSRQGIAIAGNAGQPVRAAAAGTIVYSGAGLVGYGELIIIKHDDEWLSAYGHNRRRLVAEGATVSAGQQIAEMGRTGTSRDMLHFEIRRNGRPVDPTPLLPRR